jgi:hypothetical protein
MCCSPAPVPELRPGQRWLPTVRLRQPHGTLNPQVFDLELWLFEQCIRASGTVRATAAAVNRKLADAADHPVERVRQAVRDAILLRVTDAQAAGVLAALAVGDQAAIGHPFGHAGHRAAGAARRPVRSALVQALVWALDGLARLPYGEWTAAAAPGWGMVAGLLGGALLVMPLPWWLRLLGMPLVPLLAPPLRRPGPGDFEVVAADIGQGTAVLVRTRGHLLVYDTGPRYSQEADAAQRVLLPLLRTRGEAQVDLLMLSHRDIDHVGGAASLLAQWPVRAMATSLPEAHVLRAGGVPHQRCLAGQTWDWDGVHFEILHPLPGSRRNPTR